MVPQAYVAAVVGAGGGAVLLPPMPFHPAHVLSLLDGLVITGGADVGPSRYGAPPHDETDSPRDARDSWELALCQAAVESDLPLLAVCRGLQVLNVALGGTLHQHLPEVVGHDRHRRTPGAASSNPVTVEAGSALASILGPGTVGLCHHHQAVDRLGGRLRPVGFAADGTVEAVELPGQRFAVGVQWHPEGDPTDNRLFVAFVEAAAQYRERRTGQRRTGAGAKP